MAGPRATRDVTVKRSTGGAAGAGGVVGREEEELTILVKRASVFRNRGRELFSRLMASGEGRAGVGVGVGWEKWG